MENIDKILVGLRHISSQLNELLKINKVAAECDIDMLKTESTDVGELQAALAKAQSQMKPLIAESEGASIGGSGKKAKFASLPAIIEHVKIPLGNNGLSITQSLMASKGSCYIVTTLRHSSGQMIRDKAPIFLPERSEMVTTNKQGYAYTKDYNQECGKAISYMRRYAIECMLFLKGDVDDYDRE